MHQFYHAYALETAKNQNVLSTFDRTIHKARRVHMKAIQWCKIAFGAVVGMAVTAPGIRADVDDIPIPTGETVVFSEDFDNNAQEWRGVAVVNGVGTPAAGKAAIGIDPGGTGESVFYYSTNSTTALESWANLSFPVNLADGNVAMYFRVRTSDTNSNDSFRLRLQSGNLSCYGGMALKPSTAAGNGESIHYKTPAVSGNQSKTSYFTFASTNDYRVCRVVLSKQSDTETKFEVFLWNGSLYQSKQSYTANGLITENFGQINAYITIGGSQEPIYLDAIKVTASTLNMYKAVAGIQVPIDQFVAFADDFDDNAKGWSNVAVTNGAGTPAADKAAIGADPGDASVGVMYPSAPDGTALEPRVTLGNTLDLTRGPANLYVRLRSDSSVTYDRFIMGLLHETGYGKVYLKPTEEGGGAEHMRYKNGGGTDAGLNFFGADSITFPDPNVYEIVRLKIYQSDTDETTLEAWTWQGRYVKHVTYVRGPDDGGLITNAFDTVSLYWVSPHTGELMFVDSVVVTEPPPVGTLITVR
jgi:hypothetical protein